MVQDHTWYGFYYFKYCCSLFCGLDRVCLGYIFMCTSEGSIFCPLCPTMTTPRTLFSLFYVNLVGFLARRFGFCQCLQPTIVPIVPCPAFPYYLSPICQLLLLTSSYQYQVVSPSSEQVHKSISLICP